MPNSDLGGSQPSPQLGIVSAKPKVNTLLAGHQEKKRKSGQPGDVLHFGSPKKRENMFAPGQDIYRVGAWSTPIARPSALKVVRLPTGGSLWKEGEGRGCVWCFFFVLLFVFFSFFFFFFFFFKKIK